MESVEVGLRREAARRRLAGESPRAIARDLGRTRQWVAKWTGRYDPHDPVWAEGRSRVPGRVANRTDAGIEARVLEVRTRLEENPWAQIGAPAVGWELEKLGAVVPLSARSSGSLSLAAPRTASGPLAARRQAGEATARQPQLRTDGERVGAEHEGVGCASGQQRPQDVGIGGAVQAHEEPAEAQRGDQRQLDARPSGVSSRRILVVGLARGEHDAYGRRRDARELQPSRPLPGREADHDRHRRPRGRDRGDDAHRAKREGAIEGAEGEQAAQAPGDRRPQ